MVKAFLIGAGATRSQYHDAPLSSDFFEKLAKKNGILYSAIRDSVGPYLKGDLRKLNVEDVMIESYKLSQSLQTNLFENIHIAIFELIAESTESNMGQMQRYFKAHTRPQTLFKTLINDRRFDSKDFFMTLNYDLYLDREIYAYLNEIDYGIDQSHLRAYDLKFGKKSRYSIYHLHGSLNWVNFENEQIIIKNHAFLPKLDKSGHNLCIVPPGKKEFPPIIKSLWTLAENRLLWADELIIIGCSLNPNDKELNDLVTHFVKLKGSENVKIIHSRKSEDSQSYKNYLKIVGKDFKDHPYGFHLNGPESNPKLGAIEFIFDNVG